MSGQPQAAHCLQESGLRLTPQRLLILETLQNSSGHVSAEDICARVRETYPFVNISTVYRTLDTLRVHGLVAAALEDDNLRYHWADHAKHHHLKCQRCGTMLDLDEDLTKDLTQAIQRRYSFQANLSHLTIFGICESCQT